jgi:branched-chain amino acid transport system substrate-binding protein
VNRNTMAIFAGAILLMRCVPALSADDRSGILRGLASRAGLILGAASACPGVARARIETVAGKISEVVKSLGGASESTAILALFDDSLAEGKRSVTAQHTDCALAERQLAELETASAATPPSAPAPVLAPPQAVAQAAPLIQPQGALPPAAPGALRGVTATEVRFGAAMPLSGPNKQYGQQIRMGIETAFRAANDAGGVHGRMLRFIAADDGYEPARTPDALKQLYERDQVLGFIGNFGTPTGEISLPFALEHQMLNFCGYTGAGLLRRDPPDHYVFNYRPSYSEETDAAVRYLIKLRRLKPEQIAVFAQADSYGEAGFQGVAKAMRALRGGEAGTILRLSYARNTVDIDGAVIQLKASKIPIKAIVMQATYRPAAKFIEKTRDGYPGLIYTNPSTVGAISFRDELMLLGPKYMAGIIVTQTVPAADGYSSLVLQYKTALSRHFPGEAPDHISLEYFIAGQILIEAVKRTGPQLDTEKLIETFESIHDLDIGLGAPILFTKSEHQGSHKIWGTQLNENGKYEAIELQ